MTSRSCRSRQNSAIRVTSRREVMWPFDGAEASIEALAAARRVILGLDLRSDGPGAEGEAPKRLATELPWESFNPSNPANAVEDGRGTAIEALQRPTTAELVASGYSWVLITRDV